MSFREKLAWASLIAHFLVFGPYFAGFANDWSARAASDDHGLDQIVGAIVLLVAISIALAIIATLSAPKEWRLPIDERERIVRLQAANITAALVTTGVLGVMAALLMGWNGVLAANLLLGVLVVGEIVKATVHIVQLRAVA